jgi:hypothetical protein
VVSLGSSKELLTPDFKAIFVRKKSADFFRSVAKRGKKLDRLFSLELVEYRHWYWPRSVRADIMNPVNLLRRVNFSKAHFIGEHVTVTMKWRL